LLIGPFLWRGAEDAMGNKELRVKAAESVAKVSGSVTID
jgi:hypothetical protein